MREVVVVVIALNAVAEWRGHTIVKVCWRGRLVLMPWWQWRR